MRLLRKADQMPPAPEMQTEIMEIGSTAIKSASPSKEQTLDTLL